jgi:sugar phosphate isomerase/epimerase
MQLGVSTIMFRNDGLDRDMLAKMKAAGVESVEISDYHPGFNYRDAAKFLLLGQALADLGLHLNSLHAHLKYLDPNCNLTVIGSNQRRHMLDSYRLAIDALQAMGGDILVTHDIDLPDPDDPLHARARAALLTNLKNIALYAEQQNVRITLENLGHGYYREPERLVTVIETLGQENVGLCIDTGHRNLSGSPAEALRTTGKHLFTVHIHDNDGERDEHLLPGRGNIDWPGVMQTLHEINYPGVFMYELNRPEDLATVAENFQELI